MQTLIVFSPLRWNAVYQRPQHLLTRLAQRYKIVYMEEPIRTEGLARFEREIVAPNVEVLRPLTPLVEPGFNEDQLSVLRPLLAAYLQTALIDDYLVWFHTPMAYPLLNGLQPRAVVYDCVDELEDAFQFELPQMQQCEAALLRSADLVLTRGPGMREAKCALNPNVLCVPSGVDARHYDPAYATMRSEQMQEAAALQGHIGGPRLGFFGAIDERIDIGLIGELAHARPQWQLVMAGPVVKIDPDSLPQAPNLHWLGPQPYDVLPQLMAGWDICLLPFAINESTRFLSAIKALAYMAAEKPIVSTPVLDVVSLYGGMVAMAQDAATFARACERLLNEAPMARYARVKGMRQTVAYCTWDSAAQKTMMALDEVLSSAKQIKSQSRVRADAFHKTPDRIADKAISTKPAFAAWSIADASGGHARAQAVLSP